MVGPRCDVHRRGNARMARQLRLCPRSPRMRAMATTIPARTRLLVLSVLGNFGGAVLSYLYFREIDTAAASTTPPVGGFEIVFFFAVFGAIFMAGRLGSRAWARPLAVAAGTPPPGPAGDTARRRALLMPAFIALLSWAGWVCAGVVWGVLLPLLLGSVASLEDMLRATFGITFVGGTFVATSIFLGAERVWRNELPRFFPHGDLSAANAPRLRVRTRMLAVLLLVGLLPLAVLAVAALTRANALLGADAASATRVIHNLIGVVGVIAAGGLVACVGLAMLVAGSIAEPLRELQQAMTQVRAGALDVRCAVTSNDEIGAAAEGFNSMVEGLRERERIRHTFGQYVSPEVRDEILAGRAATEGVLREVTVLFADLRDFTPWVESCPAAEVVADLNAYFGAMDGAIRAHGGLVLQFIGDEIEAVFGAPKDNPQHADAAVAAARAMCAALESWNEAQRAAGKRTLRHGIGIHSGSVIAGNIGSGDRLSYALVGDTVNVASRIQALNKEFGTTVLVSAATQARLASSAGLVALPAARVKGHAAEVAVFALG